MKNKTYYSNGKLLISGEYLVLDGALSLAVPTKFGQSLIVKAIDNPKIIWKSFDSNGTLWFESEFLIKEIVLPLMNTGNDISIQLLQILNAAKSINPNFLNSNEGFSISTYLTFPKNWGLGTSSTLINNISQWANVDAYLLLEKTFGGSGYDIACAQYNSPIHYQIQNNVDVISSHVSNDKHRFIKQVAFNPPFKEHIYFVYLNKKQNSRDGILKYKENRENLLSSIVLINTITSKMASCKILKDFEKLIVEHENIISNVIKQKPAKELLFNDFNGEVKSLGAWGGDFVLVTSKYNPTSYFKNKGFEDIISYNDMVL